MKNLLYVIVLFVLLSGCTSYNEYFKLDKNYLQRRNQETRYIEGANEEDMLVAAGQVLQDLGYMMDEIEFDLGLLTGFKTREAIPKAGQIGIIVLAALGGTQAVYDVSQQIYVTIISTKHPTRKGYNVRVEFARVIFNNLGQSRAEKIQDEKIYMAFFDKLSQSLFLTENNL